MIARLAPAFGAKLQVGLFWSLVVLILLYMTIPAIVVVMTSFSPSELLEFPPSGLSLKWYARAVAYPDFQDAFANGLIVTSFASTLALMTGASFAYLIDRYPFPGRTALEAILASPLIVPHFTTGLGFLLVGVGLGIGQTLYDRHRYPCSSGAAIRHPQRLRQPAQSRPHA